MLRSGLPLALALAVAWSVNAQAETFHWEVAGSGARTELDPLFETDVSAVTGTYYFGGVEDAEGPLALASFFDPATRLSVALRREETSSHPLGAPSTVVVPDLVGEADEYSVSGRYVLPSEKWYFGGRYGAGDAERPLSLTEDSDSHEYGLFAGRYLGAATTLELSLGRDEDETKGRGIVCVGMPLLFCAALIPRTTRATTDTSALDFLHVRKFRELTYTVSARVAETSGGVVIQSESFQLPLPPFLPSPPFGPSPGVTVPARTDEFHLPRFRVYSAGGELFPTQRLGVRIGYSRWDGEGSIDDAYDLAATWFVTRNVGLQFSFARQRADDDADFRDTDSAAVRVTGRF